MTYSLLISEKPQAAQKIANALADGKVEKKQKNGIAYYNITHDGKEIVVACAVGHLFNLAPKTKGWSYPVFDFEWKPSYQIQKSSAFTKKYVEVLKSLVKNADSFYNFCDVDMEGELIFRNVLRFICEKEDAKRAYFSTLTKEDLLNAYNSAKPHIDIDMAESGEARHSLDWLYGINLSRALTLAVKTTGKFALLSSGRVQGPALKLIVDKEKEIQAFKSTPYWQIELIGDVKKCILSAWHEKDKFWDKKEAETIFKNVKGKEVIVSEIKKSQFDQSPPTPFDLTTLQMESYRLFRINPKQTLEIAQRLYLAGVISYPRTSSQQLPESINYKKIITALAKQEEYTALCKELLKKPLKPNNGKKTDPAHPAIHPTGETASLDSRDAKVYDLIVKRTLATFSDKATRETMEIDIVANKEKFITKGSRTIEKGWHKFYAPYVKLNETEFPDIKADDKVKVKDLQLHSKETQPPKRYTAASIVKELESRSLGTKSTRSEIIDTLYQRNYIKNESIEATELGMKTIEVLQKYSPDILDEQLTRHFEEEMDQIQEGKIKKEKVLEEAKKVLTKILEDFKKKEKAIGEKLAEANIETQNEANYIGKCPACKEGDLMLRRGKFGIFVACNKYPE